MRKLVLLLFLGCGNLAWAAGGTCPSGSIAIDIANSDTTRTLTTFSALGITSCYFIAAAGADTNTGTDETHPWAHAPGMNGCSNNCNSTAYAAGLGFIFKGGDTWTMSATTGPGCSSGHCYWRVQVSGTTSHPIYVGVDTTWYTGGSWTRPILDGAGADFGQSGFFSAEGDNIIFSSFEMRNILCNGAITFDCEFFSFGAQVNVVVDNVYIHHINTNSYSTSSGDPPLMGGDSHSPTENSGGTVMYSVIDNSDGVVAGSTSNYCCAAIFHGPTIIHHNYINHLDNGVEAQGSDLHDNWIRDIGVSFDPTAHGNAFEQLAAGSHAAYHYNNRIESSTEVNWWTGGNHGVDTDYEFNNVFLNTSAGNVWDECDSSFWGSDCYTTNYRFNNTIECGPDSSPTQLCTDMSSTGASTTNNYNVHYITTSSLISGCGGSTVCNATTNLGQSKSTASSAGYTLSNQFQPTSGASPTVAAGTDETSLCNGMGAASSGYGNQSAAIAACKKSTTLGVGYDSTNHVVIVPALATVSRPNGSAWDIGAYQYNGAAPSLTATGSGTTLNGASTH